MTDLREVRAVVRVDCVPELLAALKGAASTRFFVSRIHALGAGVDPES
jgi:hypothetical protein